MSVCLKPDGISSSTSWLPRFTMPSTYQHVENAKSVHKISTFFMQLWWLKFSNITLQPSSVFDLRYNRNKIIFWKGKERRNKAECCSLNTYYILYFLSSTTWTEPHIQFSQSFRNCWVARNTDSNIILNNLSGFLRLILF